MKILNAALFALAVFALGALTAVAWFWFYL